MLSNSGANPNYLATVVELGEPIKHPKADRLQIFLIEGCRVITDMSRKQGDIGVFFVLESKLNHDLLSGLNMYEDKNLNVDNTKKGYVGTKGRVRAVKLREEPSMGLFLTLGEIESVLGGLVSYGRIGEEFDTWNGKLICEKYIPRVSAKGHPGNPPGSSKNRVKKFDRMVEGQFRLHEDTANFRKNAHKIDPHDFISLTYKMHGTSWVVANVLTKKKLGWLSRVARWLGVKVKEEEYGILYSSRSVIKNKFVNPNPQHYFGVDLWGDIKDYLDGKIPAGFTLYGEAVGYTSTGAAIQKGYDYGYKPAVDAADNTPYSEGQHYGVYIYRITYTNVDGNKIELSWGQIKEYCAHFGLKHVPEVYYGKALGNLGIAARNAGTDLGEHWHANLLRALETTYLEKDCHMCSTKVPAEGIVVRKDKLYSFEAYKLKSFRFLEGETKALDAGEISMEDEQSEKLSS